jgi:hypothetical protein
VVLDVDPRNGGELTFKRLERDLGALPTTLTAASGRRDGGRHRWFRTSLAARNIRGHLGDGVDVKKFGGYVVAPPSIHPDTGRSYYWAPQHRVQALPARWDAAIRLPSPPKRKRAVPSSAPAAVTRALEDLANAPVGERNNQLFKEAVWLAELQILVPEVEAQLLHTADDVGLDPDESCRTVQSAKDRYRAQN